MTPDASTLVNPVRYLMQRIRPRSNERPAASRLTTPKYTSTSTSKSADTTAPASILDAYCTAFPTAQNALDIFANEWSSQLPAAWNDLQAGSIPLFEDVRIAWGLAELGGIDGQDVLELGPLEAGHSYMLEQAGAATVTAIEANTRAYLKCLIVKEILGLKRTRFLCGDFMEYLRHDPPRYDFVLASGVLYHLRQPVELIDLLARVTDRVLVWTHYYDEEIIRSTPHLAPKFPSSETIDYQGFRHTLYRQEYAEGLAIQGFCGGSASYSAWLNRADLLNAFRHFGFRELRVHMEQPDFTNGPCLLLAARKGK